MLVLVTYLVEADRFDKGLLCLYLVIIGYQNSLAYTYNQKKSNATPLCISFDFFDYFVLSIKLFKSSAMTLD